MPRSLHDISVEIRKDWRNPYFGAVPYISAMTWLESLDDMYGADTAEMIVLYFLANAQTWKGDTARRIKAELKAMLKAHN